MIDHIESILDYKPSLRSNTDPHIYCHFPLMSSTNFNFLQQNTESVKPSQYYARNNRKSHTGNRDDSFGSTDSYPVRGVNQWNTFRNNQNASHQ